MKGCELDLTEMMDYTDLTEKELQIALFQQYYKMAYTYACNIAQDYQLAGTAVQESFVKVFRKLSSLDNLDSFGAKLAVIVRNAVIDVLRKESRPLPEGNAKKLVYKGAARGGMTPEEVLLDTIYSLAMDLDLGCREVLLLRYYWELSNEEIASVLSIRTDLVLTRINRGKDLVRYALIAEKATEI